ncbi:MAG TPA: ChrR family anti-sigma-E factor [Rhizomicrobium sp.]|jgi:putative transcriptional regulator|nr:ChrR family anti-sigma-E factor [Rhizomicrobium sp.]
MIRHHPDEGLLLAYAGGATDEATSLIVATHMGYCGTCRAQAAKLEAIGGGLLQDLTPVPMSSRALDSILARLDAAPVFERRAPSLSRDGTPNVLRRYIGGDLDQVRWRRVNANVSYKTLFRRGPVTARLLRGVAGAETGPHRHQGAEYTLVLKGGFADVTGRYGPGDLQMMEGDMRHNPVADPGEDCINLAVTRGSLKFESLSHRILAPLFGF